MNLYIDEHYDEITKRTLLVVLRISERDIDSVYKAIRKIIKNKETDIKIRQLLLNELKANKLRNKNYWGNILSEIYAVTSIHQYIILPHLPKEKKNFQKAYAQAIKEILSKEDIMIFADNINSKGFMEPIIVEINDKRFKFCNSIQNKGIQLADLVASTYKSKKIEKSENNIFGLTFHVNPESIKDVDILKTILKKIGGKV